MEAQTRFHVVLCTLLLLSFIAGVFSFINPVPFLVLLFPSFVLIFQLSLSLSDNIISKRVRRLYYAAGILLIGASLSISTFDYLEYASIVLSLLWACVVFAIQKCWLQFSLFLLRNCDGKPRVWLSLLCTLSYPTMLTAIFIACSLSPLSSISNVSNGLYAYESLTQIASVFGVFSVTFLHFWFTVLASLYIYQQFIATEKDNNDHDMNDDNNGLLSLRALRFTINLRIFVGVVVLVLLYGGFRLHVQHFYHRSPAEYAVKEKHSLGLMTALCITENYTLQWQSHLADVEVIITAEEYTSHNDSEYAQLLQYAQQVAFTYNHSVLVGIGIYSPRNAMELWIASPSSSVSSTSSSSSWHDISTHWLSTYLKANPVPLVEAFTRREQKPPIVDLSAYDDEFDFSVSTLICFDMLYPDWSALAHGATLVLNPSWLWGALSEQFMNVIRFRAIENGFTILHCAQNGNMAAIDGYGRIMYQHGNSMETQRLSVAQLSGHQVQTAYALFGFVFDYIVLVVGVVYFAMSTLIICRKQWMISVMRCTSNNRCQRRVKKSDNGMELENYLQRVYEQGTHTDDRVVQ